MVCVVCRLGDYMKGGRFHLFPEQEVKFDLSFAQDKCVVRGLHNGTYGVDGEKKWYSEPDLIAIVQARKNHRCDRCGGWIKVERDLLMRNVVRRDWYVGLSSFNCLPPWWGYECKLCIPCSREVFKGIKVYRCDGWDMGEWSKQKPEINKPSVDFIEELSRYERQCQV